MSSDMSNLAWPIAYLGDALEGLALKSGLASSSQTLPPPADALARDGDSLSEWIGAAASCLGLEAEPAATSYEKVAQVACALGPALLRLPSVEPSRFLALLRGTRGRVCVLRPDLGESWIKADTLRDALCSAKETELSVEFDELLRESEIPRDRREPLLAALLRERLRGQPVGGCWLLRRSPATDLWCHLRQAHVLRRLCLLSGTHAAEYLLWVLSWFLIGRAALEGRFDYGWLLGWALLLLTLVPLRLFTTWLQGLIAIGAGVVLKQRVLYGTLRLQPDEIRQQGVGQFLGRVIESQAVESLALGGGFLALVAMIELTVAALILSAGAGGVLQLFLLIAWVTVSLLLSWRYAQQRQRWTRSRLQMTHDLVERMVGYRTRLVQESPDHWHSGEDQALERYLEQSLNMDRTSALLMAAVPRGWLLVALLGLTPRFMFGEASASAIAIALGGTLLAYQALKRLSAGLWNLADASISWRQIAPLFHAGSRQPLPGLPGFAIAAMNDSPASKNCREVVRVQDLTFRHAGRADPVLRKCSFSVQSGDRVLLEGSSGSGKSTLAALLVGQRSQDSGLLLLEGCDRQSLGDDGWRRRIVSVPQFHENHVLTETLAFNLLMGRRWPPMPRDLEEADALCRELGLGELLERMPAGMQQIVGDTGWRLSQGERSRVFIGRALLQGAEMIVLDESFAALDPETLGRVVKCVEARASTLVVIAHP